MILGTAMMAVGGVGMVTCLVFLMLCPRRFARQRQELLNQIRG